MSDAAVERPRPRVGIITRLFYGFGSIAYGIKDGGFRAFVLIYYNQVIGVPAQTVGLAIMVALVFDALLDPIIGHISDNWRSKWGRRHPFMYFAALPAAASFFFLFDPPAGLSGQGMFLYILVMAVVVRTFITMYEIPSSSLVAELSENYDQRTAMISWRYFFGIAGILILAIYALTFLLLPNPASAPREAYVHYAFLSAIIMFGSILISALGTHRHIPWLRKPEGENKTLVQLVKEMASTLANRSFLMLMIAGIFNGAAQGLAAGLGVYWTTYLWRFSSQQQAILIVEALLASTLALILAPRISKRFGKKPTAITCLVLAIVISIIPYAMRYYGLYFENGSPYLLPALWINGAIYSTFGTIALILTSSMIADVVEDSELKTGRRSEGLFFAANSLIQKAISGVGLFVTTTVLTFVAFPEHTSPEALDPAILRRLIEVFIPSLAGLYVIGILFMSNYRISRASHEENLRKLAEKATAPP